MINIDLDKLYILKYIERCNNLPRVHYENVAEHLFFTSFIVYELSKLYKFNLQRAILIAMTHDVHEIYLGDITRNVKNQFTELDVVVSKIEKQIIFEKYPDLLEYYIELENQETVESKIVKLADNLSMLQYVETEFKLGNKHNYFVLIYDRLIVSINQFEKDLKELKISD